MSKAVMHSVSPQQCERIAAGEQTILLSKTRPKLETPFKDYIYMTKCKKKLIGVLHKGDDIYGTIYDEETPLFIKTYIDVSLAGTSLYGKDGKVIGEFVCDKISRYGDYEGNIDSPYFITPEQLKQTCLTYDEFKKYGKNDILYGWHISDLVIYDKPRELGEFKKPCPKGACDDSNDVACYFGVISCKYRNERRCKAYLTRPFQSWGYVEEI